MSESKRKMFTGGQKAKVALEAIKGVKTINQIAQDFRHFQGFTINETMLK